MKQAFASTKVLTLLAFVMHARVYTTPEDFLQDFCDVYNPRYYSGALAMLHELEHRNTAQEIVENIFFNNMMIRREDCVASVLSQTSLDDVRHEFILAMLNVVNASTINAVNALIMDLSPHACSGIMNNANINVVKLFNRLQPHVVNMLLNAVDLNVTKIAEDLCTVGSSQRLYWLQNVQMSVHRTYSDNGRVSKMMQALESCDPVSAVEWRTLRRKLESLLAMSKSVKKEEHAFFEAMRTSADESKDYVGEVLKKSDTTQHDVIDAIKAVLDERAETHELMQQLMTQTTEINNDNEHFKTMLAADAFAFFFVASLLWCFLHRVV